MGYQELLSRSGSLSGAERRRLAPLRSCAYCNPQVSVTPGRTPLLAVSASGHGRVYLLREGSHDVGFAGSAVQALELAEILTRESLGALVMGEERRFGAQLIACTDGGDHLPVQGRSFGLSMVLGMLSARLGHALPRDLAASAVVEPDGRLRSVDGLPAKLRALREWMPQVRRVLVASEQTACELQGIKLLPVESLAQATQVAFEQELDALICGGLDARGAQAMARQVFEQCVVRDPTLLSWRVVRGVADRLLDRDDLGERGRDHAQVAAAVAGRHCNLNLELSPQLIERLPAGVRLRLYAQQVQALADSANPQWRDLAVQARGLLAGGMPSADHASLLGALGRLHAAWGELGQARADLERALSLWEGLYALERGSRAFCELLRVCALLGDPEPIQGHWWLSGSANLAPQSLSYVRLAQGRAWAILGHPDAARPVLEALLAEPALPAHVRATALRTLWEIDGVGLEELEAHCARSPELHFNLSLVAIAQGRPAKWREKDRPEYERALQVWGGPGEVLRAWRY